jgi:arylsulfatase A-like enzyme
VIGILPLQMSAQQPNIILIMTDQQTANAMSNRGNPNVSTPAMDELAADGIVFTRAYCSYPLSGPSRASIMTGKMPGEIKVLENGDSLSEEEQKKTIGFTMQQAGYDCLYAGKWHVAAVEMPDRAFGFRKIAGMNDPDMAAHIAKELSKKRNNPLFLVASYLNPHEICEYARSQTLHYGEVPVPNDAAFPELPSNFEATTGLSELLMHHKKMSPKLYPTENYTDQDWKNYLYVYYRLVERVDSHIGELIKILKDNDLYDNSVIIFTSDHGDGVAAHKWNQKRALFEESIQVPLIIKPLKRDKAAVNHDIEALINIGIDLYPTICDYGKSPIPSELNGISLKKIIEGTGGNHQSIFVETHFDAINGRSWCVIKENYKYVFYRFFKNREQLFDLSTDKGETINLLHDSRYENVYREMKAELLHHAQKVNDKMLIKDLNF